MNGKIITVRGEEAMLVTKPQLVPYVEATEWSFLPGHFENHFTRPIIENIEEEDGESPLELSIHVLHLDPMSEVLISPTAEGQEHDNWEAEDIPMLYFE